jgi:NhaP-type Na+/H+ or K+/H+ antiporter
MVFDEWTLLLGMFLLTMVFAHALLDRLSLTSAMVYLLAGWLLGPRALDVLRPDPIRDAALLERAAEVALLISLFAVGLRAALPLRDRRWHLPLRLAFASMAAMVLMIAAVGVFALGLPLGAAVLLGAILAPTDPVLASGVRSERGKDPDRLGFSLAGEGGLNDGTAFPFAVLGLALLKGDLAHVDWLRWFARDLLWATAGGLAIGAALGAAVGRAVVHLRSRHNQAVGLDVFLCLGLIAVAHGLAQRCGASGFLAVFAAGLALRRVGERPSAGSHALEAAAGADGHSYATMATHSHHASATMRESVEGFNEQIEKIAEMALVLLVGAMLPQAKLSPALIWFVPLLLLGLRPLSVLAATSFDAASHGQRAMVSWFGIRGVGSVFYLLWALREGAVAGAADTLVSLTLWTVAASVVVHGLTAGPLMRLYRARRRRAPTADIGR